LSLAVNSKLHSFVYLLPILPFFIEKKGQKTTAFFGLLSILMILFPFFIFKSLSFSRYLEWLSQATKHDFLISIMSTNFTYSFFFLLPVIIINFLYFSRFKKNNNLLNDSTNQSILLLFLSYAIISIISSKSGAGSHHLLPLALITALISGLSVKRLINSGFFIKDDKLWGVNIIAYCMLCSWFCSILVLSSYKQYELLSNILHDSGHEVTSELNDILKKYNDFRIMMGYSDNENYKYTFFRPLLSGRDSNYFLDASALMDMQYSGLKIPESTIDKIKSQIYDIILIPNGGDPFSLKNYYTNKNLFNDHFVDNFKKNYFEFERWRYYVVWFAKNHKNKVN